MRFPIGRERFMCRVSKQSNSQGRIKLTNLLEARSFGTIPAIPIPV